MQHPVVHLARVLFVLLLAGCPELVSVDDPRTIANPPADASVEDRGRCTGSAVSCHHRSQAQCNAGCTLAPGCRSPVLERCASHRDAIACGADTSCRWRESTCEVEVGSLCRFLDSGDCMFNSVESCVWASACTGQHTYCFQIETSAPCSANVGCTWIAE